MSRQPPLAAVADASNSPVVDAGIRLGKSGVMTWPFVSAPAPYLGGNANAFAERIVSGLAPKISPTSTPPIVTPSTVEKEHLADYLALSTVAHCLDGWRYLSLAADAVTRGARTEVIHLAYYAELRAALSMLAGDGIGIMNNPDHFALNNAGNVIPIHKGSTHSLAWSVFNNWIKLPGQGQRLLRIFSCFGVGGMEWLEAMRGSLNADAIAAHWLSDWAMDLQTWGGDSGLRNEVSYRPNLQNAAYDHLQESELDLVSNCVRASLSGEFSAFDSLDVSVTWKLAEAVASANQVNPSAKRMTALGLKELSHQYGWSKDDKKRRFKVIVEANNGPAASILNLANESNLGPTGVFSRAFLMMRLSSGLLRDYWKQVAPMSTADHDWIRTAMTSYGRHCGLWDTAKATPAWEHLSSDFESCLEDTDDWVQRNKPFNPFRLIRELPEAVYHLCRFERIPLLACQP